MEIMKCRSIIIIFNVYLCASFFISNTYPSSLSTIHNILFLYFNVSSYFWYSHCINLSIIINIILTTIIILLYNFFSHVFIHLYLYSTRYPFLILFILHIFPTSSSSSYFSSTSWSSLISLSRLPIPSLSLTGVVILSVEVLLMFSLQTVDILPNRININFSSFHLSLCRPLYSLFPSLLHHHLLYQYLFLPDLLLLHLFYSLPLLLVFCFSPHFWGYTFHVSVKYICIMLIVYTLYYDLYMFISILFTSFTSHSLSVGSVSIILAVPSFFISFITSSNSWCLFKPSYNPILYIPIADFISFLSLFIQIFLFTINLFYLSFFKHDNVGIYYVGI